MGFKSGKANRVFWQPAIVDDEGDLTYETSEVEFFNFRHNWEENDEAHEVTSSCHGGVQAFIPGIIRGQGEVSAHIRASEQETVEGIGIRAQQPGRLRLEFGNRVMADIPLIITRVAWTNEVAGGTDVSFSFKLNAEAGEYAFG